jgi:menaquinol-cytochrome c reductase iron-sulfur subunit
MTHEDEVPTGAEICAGCEAIDAIDAGRRSFFGILLGACSVLIGSIVGLPLSRFVLYPVYAKGTSGGWSDVGDAKEFENTDVPVSKTITLSRLDGWREVVQEQSVYVHRTAENKLQVMSAICPHLGCSVAWQASQHKFVCPCHGGQFRPDGQHISGPPPRGLDILKAQVRNGRLQVQFELFRSNVPDQKLLG